MTDLALPIVLKKFGLWHGLVWVARLEGAKTCYLYIAPSPLNARCLSDSSPKEEYPEDEAQLGTQAFTLRDLTLKKLVFHKETSVVSLYFSDRRILHLHCAGAHATLTDECGLVTATSSKRLKVKEAYTPPPDRTTEYVWNELSLDELRELAAKTERELLEEKAERTLKKALDKAEKKWERIKEDVQSARNADHYRRLGDLLKINYHLLKPGMEVLVVRDIFEPDAPETEIKLLKKEMPSKSVSHYYELAEKAERGLATLEKREEETRTEIAGLKEKLQTLSRLDVEELKALTAEGIPKQKKPAPQKEKKANPYGSHKVYRCASSDGFKIIIGRNASDNDYVTMKLARGNDGWLHVRDYPGSHAVIRWEKGREITQTAWREAAELCAALSKAPDLAKVDVIYTYKKYVSKPKHAKAGSVLVAGGKNIVVTKDAAKNKVWRETHFSED